MKQGGQLIYGGPLGSLSRNMIQYFEVRNNQYVQNSEFVRSLFNQHLQMFFQAIPGVPHIRDGQNPATWMLDVTSPAMEYKLGIDYGIIFSKSSLYM